MKISKKYFSLILSFSLMFNAITGMNVLAEDTQNSSENVEIIIKYDTQIIQKNNVELVLENAIDSAENIEIIDEIENVEDNTVMQLVSMDVPENSMPENTVNAIDGVYYAEPNYSIKLLNDPYFNNQWALDSNNQYGINIENAREITLGNEDVLVAVLDTGIDINHPDLNSNVFHNTGETLNNRDTDDNGYVDDINGWDFTTYTDIVHNGDNSVYDDAVVDAHGTHVAGIIAAGINNIGVEGVAPNVKILPVKVLNDETGTVFNAIKGIEYAEMMGAKIANCSWGSNKYSQFLYDTINNSNMLFVCAAGNDYSEMEENPTYPAAYDLDNIISVGAIDSFGQKANFSNYGEGVDILAPGVNIYSTLPQNTYGNLDGTSMAAPYVSGTAALLLSVYPNIVSTELRNRIISTSKYMSQYTGITESNGILDTSTAVMTTIGLTNVNSGIYGSETILADNSLYVVGGYNNSGFLNSILKFIPDEESWEQITTLPIPVADMAVATYNNKIYICGGNGSNSISNNVQIYDIHTNTWSQGTPMPYALYGTMYVEFANELYVFGGIGIGGYQNKVYKYSLIEDEWEELCEMPFKSAYGSAVNANGQIFLIGGCNENTTQNSILTFNSEDNSFNNVGHLAVNRKDFASVYRDNKIYVFGGSNSYNTQGKNKLFEYSNAAGGYIDSITNSVEVYDLTTKLCNAGYELDEAMAGHTAINYFGEIYLLGGWNGNYKSTVTRYFGASIPKNIVIKTKNNALKVSWNGVLDAAGYKVEIDNEIYTTASNSYTLTNCEDIEHKIRVCAVNGTKQSLWSDYEYHYFNSTLIDAKVILPNSTNSDKLYKTGQVRWYKINNDQAGNLSVSLTNVASNCHYLLQLCGSNGEVISSGVEQNEYSIIDNVVLSPYPYYLKITSIYGGNSDMAYNLNCSFVPADEEVMPDRVRSAFLKPSSLDDLSADNIEIKDISEYEGDDDPPTEIVNKEISETKPEIIDGGCGTQPYVEEIIDEDEHDGNISLMSINNYIVETGTFNNVGDTATGSISVPRNSSSSQRYKLVVEVIPEYEYDDISIEWKGSNTNYDNFWWHYTRKDSKYVYYLTAIFGTTSGATYQYKIKYDYKSYSSNGNYTVRKYIIVDSTSNEDYNNTTCGNETPQYAINSTPSTNYNITKTGKIDHPYDRDFYYVTATSNEKVTAYLMSPTGKKYDVAIYDNRCTSNSYTETEYMDGWVKDNISYASIKGNNTSSIKYCIKVGSYDGSFSYDDTYTLIVYKYSLSRLGDLEVNNSFDNADSNQNILNNSYLGSDTKVAQSIDFNIDSPVDVDMYAISMNSGEKLSVKMDLPTSYNDSLYKYRIEIYSDVRKQDHTTTYTSRSYNNPNSDKSKFVTFIPESSGTYYVAVRSLSNQYDYLKSGTLTIAKTPVSSMDSYENKGDECSNDFVATTIFSFLGYEFGVKGTTLIQTSINANFDNELDVDWYEFENGSIAKTAIISLSGNSATSNNVGIIVLDSNYTMLSSGVSGNTYTFTPNETYYIATYVLDDRYNYIKSNRNYSISVTLDELRSDLVFHPLEWGTFVYDNDPEFLTDDDMADYNLGNRLLMSADNLSGVVDFQSSHSAKKYMLEDGNISFDVLLYNPTSEDVIVEIDRLGFQLPKENDIDWSDINQTERSWASLQAWADFLNVNLIERLNEEETAYTPESTFQGVKEYNYHTYYYKNIVAQLSNNGKIRIPSGTAKWMLGDLRPTMRIEDWQPFNLVGRMKILNDGVINMGIAAFRDIANVYTPEAAILYYDVQQRNYPTRDELGNKYDLSEYFPIETDIDGKPKGVVYSAAEVETRTSWDITDSTEFFTPTVYNMAMPNGNKVYSWVTNFNPVQDNDNYTVGVESDMLPMYFDSLDSDNNDKHWIFDTRHSKPSLGNDMVIGTPPIEEAMPLGNYGVVERYYIDINNATNSTKEITYNLKGNSHVIVTYNDGVTWKTKVKVCVEGRKGWNDTTKTYSEPWSVYYDRTSADMFTITLAPHEHKQLVMETILPNADAGGIRSSFYVN